MSDYNATVRESLKELTTRQKIAVKDFSGAQKLNDMITPETPHLHIDIDNIVIVDVHNERSKGNTDYSVIIVIDTNGDKYRTGSETFYRSAMDIYNELKEANELENGFTLDVYKVNSNNFDGDFIKCALV